ncbi:MAG: hypothetical protein U0P30_14315 [Vicinamibacterales bacterium]
MSRPGVVVASACVALLASSPVFAQSTGGELLERTLAIVGGAVVTRSDVTMADALQLFAESPVPAGPTLTRLIDRQLMLQEVARFAPAEPLVEAVLARVNAVRTRAGGDVAVTAALTRAGRDAGELEAWVRDDLRLAAYLDQRFASAGAPVEADLAAWVAAHPADVAGLAPAEALRVARERIARARRADLIADWLVDVRRRVDVVTFAPPGGVTR